MREVDASACTAICLGKQGENMATRVKFRVVFQFREQFGDGNFALIHVRQGDEAPYPVAVAIADDCVVWDVSNTDVAKVGTGKCELVYIVGGTIAKSMTFTTRTLSSIGDAGEDPPEPWESWVEEILAAGAEALAAREEWANMSAEAETLPPGSDATASYADGVLIIGVPAGIGGKWGSITGDIEDQSDLANAINEKLGDAPSDGKQYARKDGEWEEVTGGGSSDHSRLVNRDIADQHPISAITGLSEELSDKYEKPANGIPKTDLESSVQTSLGKADSSVQPEAGKGLFSGNYNDLTNRPTNVSEFYNDAGYLTSHQSLAAYRTAAAQDVIDAGKANINDIPTKTSDLTNDSGFLTEHQSLSAYRTASAQDVIDAGKQPTISDLATIRSGAALGATALQSYTETDPTVPSWAKQANKPTYTYTEVGAEQSGAVSAHNASSSAHSFLFGAKLNVSQGVAHAGEFLIVGNDGNITTQAFSVLAGGSY